MSDCVVINRTEHLPQENTLLVYYTITCNGTWDLMQQYTAYRGVCDSNWTIMYPNIQHPLHTDFPITVGNNSFQGIFAWNYGGIRGINPADFDPNHSYLTQLTIYNSDCGRTGSEPSGLNTGSYSGQPTNTGSPTGSRPGGPIPPNRPRPGYREPVPPEPTREVIVPRPVPVEPPFNGNLGNTGSADPTGSLDPTGLYSGIIISGLPIPSIGVWNPNLPTGSADPTGVNTSYGSVPTVLYNNQISSFEISVTNQAGQTIGTIYSSQDPPITQPGNPNSVIFGNLANPFAGLQNDPNVITTTSQSITPTVTSIGEIIIPQGGYNNIGRPIGRAPGDLNPERAQSIGGRSNAIAAQPGLSIQENINGNSVDISQNQYENIANSPGYLSRYSFGRVNVKDYSNQVSLSHIDTSYIVQGSTTRLEVSNFDIPKGEPLFVSASYSLPENVSVGNYKLEIWAKDSQGKVLLLTSKEESLSNFTTVGYSLDTNVCSPGPITIVSLVKDNQGKVIGVNSKRSAIRPSSVSESVSVDDRIKQSDNRTTYESLPGEVVDLLNISRDPITIYDDGNSIKYMILNKVPGSANFVAAAAIVKGTNDRYTITMHDATQIYLSEGEDGPVPPSSNEIPQLSYTDYVPIAKSNRKLIIDQEEFYPDSHSVGINRTTTNALKIIMSVGPDTIAKVNTNREIRIYLSDSYVVPKTTSEVTQGQLTEFFDAEYNIDEVRKIKAVTPYVLTELGLLIHGLDKNYINPYSQIIKKKTNSLGIAIWDGLILPAGTYYSIVLPKNGYYNLYKNIIHTSII